MTETYIADRIAAVFGPQQLFALGATITEEAIEDGKKELLTETYRKQLSASLDKTLKVISHLAEIGRAGIRSTRQSEWQRDQEGTGNYTIGATLLVYFDNEDSRRRVTEAYVALFPDVRPELREIGALKDVDTSNAAA